MSNIKTIKEKIKNARTILNSNPGDNPLTRASKLSYIKRAKDELVLLMDEYRTAVRQNTLMILVAGSQSNKFAEIAKTEFDCFRIKSSDMAEDIVKKIPEQNYLGKNCSANVFDIANLALELMMREEGFQEQKFMVYSSKYSQNIPDADHLTQVIKKALVEQFGTGVLGFSSTSRVAQQLVETDFDGDLVPVVMLCDDTEIKELAAGLRNQIKAVFTVGAGKHKAGTLDMEVSSVKKDSVEDVMVKIRQFIAR